MPSGTGFLEEDERRGLYAYQCPHCGAIVHPSRWQTYPMLIQGSVRAMCERCCEWSQVERPRAKVAALVQVLW